MSATVEAEVAVTPESAPDDAVLICDPLKIRGREWLMRTCQDDDDDDSDVGEDSGLGMGSHVGAETVSQIIDFFRQTRPADDDEVVVPEAPVKRVAEDPLEACRNVLKPLAQLITDKTKEAAADKTEDVATKQLKKTAGRKKKDKSKETQDHAPPSPGSKDDGDDEYLPPKKAKKKPKARTARASTTTTKKKVPTGRRCGRPKKPKGFVGKCKYVLTKERQKRPAPIIKAAITGPAIQAAVKGWEAGSEAAYSSAVKQTKTPKTVIKIVKPLFSQTCIIHRPFATESQLKSELVIHETYLSRMNPYSDRRINDKQPEKVDDSAEPVSELVFVNTASGFEDQSSQHES